MEQFSLEKYLENPNLKVVTRDGRPVRIICTDANEETPIAALVTVKDIGLYKLATALYTKDGRYGVGNSPYDLFFADEENELTEFDYAILSIISDHNSHKDSITEFAKRSSKKLLDLARKEILKRLAKMEESN